MIAKKRHNKDYWGKYIDLYKEEYSHVTQRAFCEEQDLKYGAFTYWYRNLNENVSVKEATSRYLTATPRTELVKLFALMGEDDLQAIYLSIEEAEECKLYERESQVREELKEVRQKLMRFQKSSTSK